MYSLAFLRIIFTVLFRFLTVLASILQLGLDLLDKMLQFNPSKRISVDEALQHPYFANLHSPEDELECEEVFDFTFEGEVVDKITLKTLMYEQIRKYHPDLPPANLDVLPSARKTTEKHRLATRVGAEGAEAKEYSSSVAEATGESPLETAGVPAPIASESALAASKASMTVPSAAPTAEPSIEGRDEVLAEGGEGGVLRQGGEPQASGETETVHVSPGDKKTATEALSPAARQVASSQMLKARRTEGSLSDGLADGRAEGEPLAGAAGVAQGHDKHDLSQSGEEGRILRGGVAQSHGEASIGEESPY